MKQPTVNVTAPDWLIHLQGFPFPGKMSNPSRCQYVHECAIVQPVLIESIIQSGPLYLVLLTGSKSTSKTYPSTRSLNVNVVPINLWTVGIV